MPKLHILLAPSETKSSGGELPAINHQSFLFEKLYPKRLPLLEAYQEMINREDMAELSKVFGIKKAALIQEYCLDMFSTGSKKAIQRYTGVAFDYLDYEGLSKKAQDYIDEQVIVFSNLFGPVSAKDHLPYYKFKQGEKLSDISIKAYYKEHFTPALDELFEGDIIDLRAGVYEKFYKISKPYTTFKFIKEGKVVSHWAKAYRGKLLKVLASNNIEYIKDIEQYLPEDMKLVSKEIVKNKSEWIIEIRV